MHHVGLDLGLNFLQRLSVDCTRKVITFNKNSYYRLKYQSNLSLTAIYFSNSGTYPCPQFEKRHNYALYEPQHDISNNVLCATSKVSERPAHMRSLIRLCWSLEYSISVKLLTEHHLKFLAYKGGCTGSSESTLVKMPHCWKSHVTAHIVFSPDE